MTVIQARASMRFCVLICAESLQEWHVRCVRNLVESGSAELTLVAIGHETEPRGARATVSRLRKRMAGALFSAYDLISSRTGPARHVSMPAQLSATVVESRVEVTEGGRYELGPEVADRIREHDLDFILCIGREARGIVLGVARHGAWAFRFGPGDGSDRGPVCAWEVYRGRPVTEARLCRLDDGPGAVLRIGRYRTVLGSWKASRDSVLSDIAAWPVEVCEQIGKTGGVAEAPGLVEASTEPAVPTNVQTMRLLVSIAWRRVRETLAHVIWRENWNVGIVAAPVHRLLEAPPLPAVRWLPARRDSYVADPFAIEVDGRVHLFYEYWDYRSHKGVISHSELTPGGAGKEEVVLELPVHVSYPFLLRHNGTVYLVPEAWRSGEVALYGTDTFPRGWRKIATLLRLPALDPTVFLHDGRWWLFATLGDEGEDLKLFAWHANDLLGPWHPHARNPIKTDVAAARPAGTPFVHGGGLYRPAQDSSESYGGRVVLNRVTSLSPTSFWEETVAVASPDSGGPFPDGLHTVCGAGDVTVIDGKRKVLRPADVLLRAAARALMPTRRGR